MTAAEELTIDADGRDYLGVVESFCKDRIGPAAKSIDRSDEWFPELMKECAELGLQAIMIDEDGNLDRSTIYIAEATTEILASYSPAVAIAVGAARLHTVMLSTYASPDVKERWLGPVMRAEAFGSMGISEPGAGSDIRNGLTVATRDGDGWVLNGSKAWTTLSPVADFTVVLAKLEATGRDAKFGLFLAERGMLGFTYGTNDSLIGYRGVPMANTYYDGVAIPASHVLSDDDGFYGILGALNFARLEAGSLGVGIMRGCLRHVSSYANQRVAFGLAIAQHQAIQLRAGEMVTRLNAARGLLHSAAVTYAQGTPDSDLCAMAKVFASDSAMATATQAISVFGGMGVSEESEIERYMRDAKTTQIFDGVSDLLTMQVGRSALGATNW